MLDGGALSRYQGGYCTAAGRPRTRQIEWPNTGHTTGGSVKYFQPTKGAAMIFGKLWHTLMAQINKLANIFWTADPIAQMQYEYDLAVAQLKEGREGLEQYRALVERVSRQVAMRQAARHQAGSQDQGLSSGRRPRYGGAVRPGTAKGQELPRPKTKSNSSCTKRPTTTTSPRSNTPAASWRDVRNKIHKYDAELKMSRAEAEMAKLANDFNFDVTTDFGQIEQVINDKIGLNRAKVRVAADLRARDSKTSSTSRPWKRRWATRPSANSKSRWGWSRPRRPRSRKRRRNSARRRNKEALAGRLSEPRRCPNSLFEVDCATRASRLVSGLGAGTGRPLLLRHDLPLRPARQRPRPDPLRRRQRRNRLLQPARIPGHAGLRPLGPRPAATI